MSTYYYLELQKHLAFSKLRQLASESKSILLFTIWGVGGGPKQLYVNWVSDNLVIFQIH